jgi:hypothetical protein
VSVIERIRQKIRNRENVAVEVCLECGERYFHATTLDAIDRKIIAAHEVKELLAVEVLTA